MGDGRAGWYAMSDIQTELDRLFVRARSQFFPKWDTAREWRIVEGRRRGWDGETGYCSSQEKRIYIDTSEAGWLSRDELLALIIHEICHDVATAHHLERWATRMEKAAQKAERFSDFELADTIRANAIDALDPFHFHH